MKKFFAAVALTLAVSPLAAAQTDDKARIEKDLRRIINEITDAFIRSDRQVLERYLAEDYVAVNANGRRQTRADFFRLLSPVSEGMQQKLNSTTLSHTSEVKEVDLHLLGATVVMSYRYDFHSGADGGGEVTSFRVTDVYTRRKGRWMLVANHRTLIPKPAAASNR